MFNGQVVFYDTEGLREITRIDCRNRRGKHSKGRKVTGLHFSPSSGHLLVTTNDSRMRLYDTDDFSMKQKYKGLENSQLQIQASFNDDGSAIICGSDDQHAYVWDISTSKSNSDRNDSYEYFKAGSDIVTVALFAPRSTLEISQHCSDIRDEHLTMQEGDINEATCKPIHQIIVTSGYDGEIKLFENRGQRQSC